MKKNKMLVKEIVIVVFILTLIIICSEIKVYLNNIVANDSNHIVSLLSTEKKSIILEGKYNLASQKQSSDDMVVDDSNQLVSSLSSGKSITILEGTYSLTSLPAIASNISVNGEGNVDIDGKSILEAILSGAHDITFKNINFKNVKQFEIDYATNIKFINCTFDGLGAYGIRFDRFNNLEFDSCKISNSGKGLIIDPTYQGTGLYLSNGERLSIHNSEFFNTYGHAAIFLGKVIGIDIHNNDIHDTFYRAIEFWETGSSGVVHDNNIHDIGKINNTNSGMGCNGIYANDICKNVSIQNNTITNCFENAIEGQYAIISSNVVNGTGIDQKKHQTKSDEGIFALSGNIENNTISNTNGPGIRSYSKDSLSNITIKGNTIYKALNSNSGIEVMSGVSYSNINVVNNISVGNKYCVYDDDIKGFNIIIDNNSNIEAES